MRPPLLYEHTDIPAGMTFSEYRRSRLPVRRSFWLRLRRGGLPA
jgi:hypothetical protein